MRNILCVENDHITSYLLEKQIERMGYKMADKVDTGEAAIERSRELKPDLVLMDIKLSGTIDGIEAAERISQELEIPVIFVTGRGDIHTRRRAEQIRPMDYLVKPVEMNVLQKVIEKTFIQVA
ncbi:response regulator [Balneolaceae bacterium ANBcel3]|nr:response regulator [Balneolaceae bacterium ANBcel3]